MNFMFWIMKILVLVTVLYNEIKESMRSGIIEEL